MKKRGLISFVFDYYLHLLAFLLPFLVAVFQFKFTFNNLSTPLVFANDEIIYANQVSTLLHHFSLTNHVFGAPFGQDLNHAFFSVDMGPAILASVFGLLTGNVYFGLNFGLLMSFGLAGLSFFCAAKLLKASKSYSFLGALVFALLPQHFITSTQAFTISNYFPIPLVLAHFFLRITNSDYSTMKRPGSRQWFGYLLLFSFGGFYSYYSLGFVFISSTLTILLLVLGKLEISALKTSFLYICVVLSGFIFSAIPSLLSVMNSADGINYLRGRSYWGVFVNSGVFSQAIIPMDGTLTRNLIATAIPRADQNFTQFKNLLLGQGLFAEGWTYVIPTGVLLLFVFSLFAIGTNRRNQIAKSEAIAIGTIALWFSCIGIIWTWSGGLGTAFALVSLGALRGFARLNIFVICSILFGAMSFLPSRFTEKASSNRLKFAGSMILVFAIFDGLLPNVGTEAGSQAAGYKSLNQITNQLKPGCAVLEFPVVHYPYQDPGYPSYRLLSLGLSEYGDRNRWSAGSVGGSAGWHEISKFVNFQDTKREDLFISATKAGYCAILVDKQVWNSFHNYVPSASFPQTPKLGLTEFASEYPSLKEIKTDYGDYLFAQLKK